MAEKIQNLLLNEAYRIGNELIKKSKRDGFGPYWTVVSKSADDTVNIAESESISSGDAGIILFLAELAVQASDEKIKDFCLVSAKALYKRCMAYPASDLSFYTGRSGIAYLYGVLGESFQHERFYDYAFNLLKEELSIIMESDQKQSSPDRNAVLLFILTFIHSKNRNDDLIPIIGELVVRVYNDTRVAEKGIHWNQKNTTLKGSRLIHEGFGWAGFVFQELANYFSYLPFEKVACAAFKYEDHLLENMDAKSGGSEVVSNNTYEYKKHIALGLSRMNVRTGSSYEKSIKKVAFSIMHHLSENGSSTQDFSLYGGMGEPALFLFQAGKRFGDDEWKNEALEIALRSFQSEEKNEISAETVSIQNSNISLFNGKAGVGYLYLTLSSTNDNSSILYPGITKKFDVGKGVYFEDLVSLETVLLKKYYPKTCIHLREKYRLDPTNLIHSKTDFNNIFSALHNRILRNPLIKRDSKLRKIFSEEKASIEEKEITNPISGDKEENDSCKRERHQDFLKLQNRLGTLISLVSAKNSINESGGLEFS